MKSLLHFFLALTLFFVGCVSEEGRPISANGQLLTFHILRASVTRYPQLSEQMEIALTGFDLGAASSQSGYTYRGPMQPHFNYAQIGLQPSESFLIVEFSVSNVMRKLQLSAKDVKLIDGKGSIHQTLGCASSQKENAWSSFDSQELGPKTNNDIKWIFIIPTDGIIGAAIQFQNSTYPVPVAN
jgi:hypothetical protein